MKRVYLDHNATTPLDPRVLEAMLPWLQGGFGNPSSLHWYGQQARAALDEARAEVASLVGGQPSEIVFTGSGTEADNHALRAVAQVSREPRRTLLVSALEHHAVLNTARALAEEGWPVQTVRAAHDGTVDLDHLREVLDERTALLSLMHANNETGVVQPVTEAAEMARSRGVLVHCDAVQSAGKIPVDVKALGVDLLALSAHKIGGPKGVGALWVKRGTRMAALIRGGSQERNRRAGTENVAGIAGFGRAAALAKAELAGASATAELRDRLEGLLLGIPGTERNGTAPRVPNTTNVSFAGVEAESLLLGLDLAGVAVSTGAACAAGAIEPSHVLKAMGLPPQRVQASLRFSLGRTNTAEEVDHVAEVVAAAVVKQRARSTTSSRR